MNRLLVAASAGLILPVALGAQADPPTVTVTMTSYDYTPSPIILQAGQPVRLLFQNKADKSHDFKAKQFFASSRILSGQAPEGEVDLKGGGSTAITLIPARGTYPVHCSKFMHSTFGMTSEIVVR